MTASFPIGRRTVGLGNPVYVIAEIGSNHDGSLTRAKRLIAESAKAGANAVKFQSFTADGLYVPRKREKGVWTENPTWRAFKGWELPERWTAPLTDCAREHGIDFLSTPFSVKALKHLVAAKVPAIKIASGDMTHLTLIRAAAATGRPVLVATGMADLHETRRAFEAAGGSDGRAGLFHCVSLYPPRPEDINLRALATLIKEFGCPVGLSDHTPGHEAVLGAIALGATMVEKHITLSRARKGPDHPYALEISEFAAMVRAARTLEKSLGDGVKRPAPAEEGERTFARRGLYAAGPIKCGAMVCAGDINTVRPALGLSADQIDHVLGSTAKRNIEKDEPLTWNDLSVPAARKTRQMAGP